ncbi:hypothetical protein DL764_010172 [Monosporascus ibericus]|uniref:Reverse transcriptase n=1 Tax=Monosporascus ibericus TaxID=155417 RepID=A0A4Q4SVZ0_9PEZI|nr:hypothetical protein DL764_010172 [Monosporascus ibericus]
MRIDNETISEIPPPPTPADIPPTPITSPSPPPDTDVPIEVRSLRATNFLTFCRMKDVIVDSMSLAKFIALTDALREVASSPSQPLSADEAASLAPSAVLRSILIQDDSLDPNTIPPRLRAFHSWIAEAPWLRRVTEEDIQKYLDGKPPATMTEILGKLPPEYHDLAKAFIPSNADALPPHRPFDHKIELLPGQTPPYSRARAMSPHELLAVRKYIDDHLEKGFIRPSSSSAAAPILLAKKPGGGVRICVDYRGLNNVTVKNRYPIPLIRETLDALCSARVYTKLDIVAAFNRLRIAPGDEWKTAFITRFGLFECLVANFGMTGAPSSFQHYINHTLFDLLDKYVTAYLDDILIYSKSKKEHKGHVREVLRRLADAGLTIDIRKCEFNVTKTRYLGLIISTDGIAMDPDKVKAIQQWEQPGSLRELQRFLGFANFYRRFIKGFSSIARPLTALMSKAKWTGLFPDDAKAAFRQLKNAFSTAPVLSYYDPRRRTVLETDASDWASGGVLSQYDAQGILRPVAFFSAKHNPAECNYEIYDKELLAIIKAFEEWRPELQGTEEPVEVITDHKNLQHFATTKLLNQRQVRWSEFLSDFRFQIIYRPGTKATVPDALSRQPGVQPADRSSTDDDRVAHRYRTMLPPHRWEVPLKAYAMDVNQPIDALIDAAYRSSALASDILAALADPACKRFKQGIRKAFRAAKADCKAVQGRIYVRDRLFVPDDDALKLQILHRSHSAAPAGHPGRFKTYDLLRRSYYWPRLSRDVATFVQGCHLCRRIKASKTSPTGFLDPLPVPFRPWNDVSVDYVGPLPPCERFGHTYEYVLVVVDRLTKMRHFAPVTDMSAKTLANAFISDVYRLHGTPATIISDRGTQFVSTFWKELSRRLGVTLRTSTAYHPQTDGQTEVVNAAMEQYLRGYCSFYQDDWVDWLPLAEFANNNHVSETTSVSPFFANYGFHPTMGTEPLRPSDAPKTAAQQEEFNKATYHADRLERVLERVRALMAESQDRYMEQANRHRSDAGTFSEGERVWVNTRYMKSGRPSDKLSDKWIGPFAVTKVYPRAVAVQLPTRYKLFPVFHTSLIQRHKPGLPGQGDINAEWDTRAEGAIVTSDESQEEIEWHFEKILSSRNTRRGLQYRVKWPHPHRPTWEPAENLKGCDSDIAEFHKSNPSKPGPPDWFKPLQGSIAATAAQA